MSSNLLVARGPIRVPSDWPDEEQERGARIKEDDLLLWNLSATDNVKPNQCPPWQKDLGAILKTVGVQPEVPPDARWGRIMTALNQRSLAILQRVAKIQENREHRRGLQPDL